ncbi:MAG: hypothetical protein WD669_01055 [Pirellulales bacterium]
MPALDEIGDDELLYRKISVKSEWYDLLRNEIKPDAFKPWPRDVAGISFDRARSEHHPEFRSIEEAARGPSAKGYYVAEFRARELRSHGFDVTPDPDFENDNPGHAVLENLRYTEPKDPQCETKMIRLAHGGLCLRVSGPFPQHSS